MNQKPSPKHGAYFLQHRQMPMPARHLAHYLREWKAEQQKARRRRIWLVPLGFLAFQILWSIWQLNTASPDDLETGYLMLFYGLPMINAILLPIMTAVIASRLCDMEIKGDTLKLLYTMQRRTGFFDCKYLAGLKYLLLFTLGQGLLILISGKLYHFGEPLKPVMLLENLAVVFCVSAVLLSIQQVLSLFSDNQIMPLVVGLAGSFLGLFSMFFPASVARLILWGYYAGFPTASMNWDRQTRIMEYYEVPFPLSSFLLFLLAGIVIFLVCRTIIIKKEV